MKKFIKKLILIIMLAVIMSSSICANLYSSKASAVPENSDNTVDTQPVENLEKEELENTTYTYKRSEPNIFIVLLSDGMIFIGELIEDIIGEALGVGLGTVIPSIESIIFNEYPITRLDYFRENVVINGQINEFAAQINSTISQLYIALLVIVIAIYIFMLVYVGIKIVITSVAEEQAKYKRTLISWTIGLALLLSFHCVMGYTIEINDLGVNFARKFMEESIGKNQGVSGQTIIQELMDEFKDEAINTNYRKLNKSGEDYFQGKNPAKYVNNDEYSKYFTDFKAINVIKAAIWLTLTIKIVLIAIKYIKRLLMVTFLILIFPFVTIAYVFDRVKDGKSHLFDIWFKTFAVNVFINFLHIVIYLIVVQMALKVRELTGLGWLLPVIAILTFDKIAEQVAKIFGITKETLNSSGEIKNVASETSKGMIAALKGRLSSSQSTGAERINDNMNMINSMNGSYKSDQPQNQLIEKVIMTSSNFEGGQASGKLDTSNIRIDESKSSSEKEMYAIDDGSIKNIGINTIDEVKNAKGNGSMPTNITAQLAEGSNSNVSKSTTAKVEMASVMPNISVNANVKAKATVDMTQAFMSMFDKNKGKEDGVGKPKKEEKPKNDTKQEKQDDEFSIENVLKKAGIDTSMLSDEEKIQIYKAQMASYQEISKEAKTQLRKKANIQKKKKL